ncbi:hypothetical protein OS493_030522 [Desmophyllum pertusum]|uniref:Uncharacterized protein n=1 Tax=Desmophyllum pertusum TaxID=174260 RepID=A0A9X0CIT6_9CNID|nr:hypothetical protein OS493_030522 [Desmophyllum pertusum]
MMDLTNEVSAGTVDSAKQTLESLLKQCNEPQAGEEPNIASVREKVLPSVTQHLVREIVSPNQTIRQQAQCSVSVLAKIYGSSVHSIMLPHKAILEDMIPPKKHLLRHQPVNTQIALMDGNTFCTTLNPRLFTMDLTVMEHKVFFHELLSLCEADDSQLLKLPCYKTVQSLTPLRKSALNALTACHYIVQVKDKIFNVLYKALNSPTTEIQEAAKECMKKVLLSIHVFVVFYLFKSSNKPMNQRSFRGYLYFEIIKTRIKLGQRKEQEFFFNSYHLSSNERKFR